MTEEQMHTLLRAVWARELSADEVAAELNNLREVAEDRDRKLFNCQQRAEQAEAERDRLWNVAREFYNATVASQRNSPGFDSDRHVTVGATHPELVDRINRAADELEAAVKETPAPAAAERIICEPTHDGRASECHVRPPEEEADG